MIPVLLLRKTNSESRRESLDADESGSIKIYQVRLAGRIDWFDGISLGLGDEFEAEFYAALQRVKDNPEHFSEDHTVYRP